VAGHIAQELAGIGTTYGGKSSPWWYSADAFWQLLQAVEHVSIREVIAELDGCSGSKASRVAGAFLGRSCPLLSRLEAAQLLESARAHSKQVKPERLGCLGKLEGYPGHLRTTGTFLAGTTGKIAALIPFVVEVWAHPQKEPNIVVCVNRSPIAADVNVFRAAGPKKDYIISGCHLSRRFPVSKSRELGFFVNIQCPYVPITTDGKEPDLKYFQRPLIEALTKAAARANRAGQGLSNSKDSQKRYMFDILPQAIRHASGNDQYALANVNCSMPSGPSCSKPWEPSRITAGSARW
jgi:hypothetical protein